MCSPIASCSSHPELLYKHPISQPPTPPLAQVMPTPLLKLGQINSPSQRSRSFPYSPHGESLSTVNITQVQITYQWKNTANHFLEPQTYFKFHDIFLQIIYFLDVSQVPLFSRCPWDHILSPLFTLHTLSLYCPLLSPPIYQHQQLSNLHLQLQTSIITFNPLCVSLNQHASPLL